MMRYLAILFLLTLVGCGGKALEVSNPGEIPAGPGIFSKKNGAVISYNTEQYQSAKTSGKNHQRTTEINSDADDFEQFKRWQDCKKNPDSLVEQDEFRQWQEYQKYKQQKTGS